MSIKKLLNGSFVNITFQLILAIMWFVFGVLHVHKGDYTSAANMLTCAIVEFMVVIANCAVTRIERKLDEISKKMVALLEA